MPDVEGNSVVLDDLLADLPPAAELRSKVDSALWYMELMKCTADEAAARYGIDPTLLTDGTQEG